MNNIYLDDYSDVDMLPIDKTLNKTLNRTLIDKPKSTINIKTNNMDGAIFSIVVPLLNKMVTIDINISKELHEMIGTFIK